MFSFERVVGEERTRRMSNVRSSESKRKRRKSVKKLSADAKSTIMWLGNLNQSVRTDRKSKANASCCVASATDRNENVVKREQKKMIFN